MVPQFLHCTNNLPDYDRRGTKSWFGVPRVRFKSSRVCFEWLRVAVVMIEQMLRKKSVSNGLFTLST
jgi:hypothetical protein